MNFSKNQLMLGAAWALTVGVGVFGVIRPAVSHMSTLEREIAEQRAELTRPGSAPETIERLARELTALRALGSERMTPIPKESGVAALVKDLSEAFDALGLKQREISTGTARTTEEASSLPMSISLNGPFPEIYKAVRRVESLDRLVRVQRLRMALPAPSARDTIDRGGQVKADLLIDVFYAPRSAAQPVKSAEVTP
ncbi:MAG: type 4a pilus biogenesis protein PilO [Planctomycetes bacterium]|nr:type 4a pilus biogenesis protein PilO [Planctomycetota bacterium]